MMQNKEGYTRGWDGSLGYFDNLDEAEGELAAEMRNSYVYSWEGATDVAKRTKESNTMRYIDSTRSYVTERTLSNSELKSLRKKEAYEPTQLSALALRTTTTNLPQSPVSPVPLPLSPLWADECTWNERFQQALSLPAVTPEQANERRRILETLQLEFAEQAKPIAKIIIEEENIEIEKRTIQQAAVSGVAGGHKFIAQGMFFKFARDFHKIYGSDEGAAKAAGHELKSLQALLSHCIPNLHFPLQTIIDYLGRRLLVSSVLPIDASTHDKQSCTLIYGSSDGGHTIINDSPAFENLLKRACTLLNLKPHNVYEIGRTGVKMMYGPADLEGHLGMDGRMYVLDLARLFPPQTPDKSGSHLYRLLRPELVEENPVPLSSDAFSIFGGADNKSQHNPEINECFNLLLDNYVPAVAKNLERRFMSGIDENMPMNACREICNELHYNGVNLRYLGSVRNYISTSEQLRTMLLLESIARAFKSLLIEAMGKVKMVSEVKQVWKAFAELLSNAFSGDDEISVNFWSEQLKPRLKDKFPAVLTDKEEMFQELRLLVPTDILWRRICNLLEVAIDPSVKDKLFVMTAPVTEADIISFHAKAKKIRLRAVVQENWHTIKNSSGSLNKSNPGESDSEGKHASEFQFYENEVHLRKRALGEDHPLVAASLESFASILISKMQYSKAQLILYDAIKIREKICFQCTQPNEPLNQREILDQISKLAEVYRKMAMYYHAVANFEQARLFILQALKLREKHGLVHGDSGALEDMFSLGWILKDMDMLDQAETAFLHGLKMVCPKDDSQSQIYAPNLSSFFTPGWFEHPLSRQEKEGILSQLLEMDEDKCPEKSKLAMIMVELARVYLHRGEHEYLLKLQYKALKLAVRAHGQQHSKVGIILNNIAIAHAQIGQYEFAKKIGLKALSTRKVTDGICHPYTGHSISLLGQIYMIEKNFHQANSLFKQATSIYERTNSKFIFKGLMNQGRLATLCGNYEEASQIYEKPIRLVMSMGSNAYTLSYCLVDCGCLFYLSALNPMNNRIHPSKVVPGTLVPAIECMDYYRAACSCFETALLLRKSCSAAAPNDLLIMNSILQIASQRVDSETMISVTHRIFASMLCFYCQFDAQNSLTSNDFLQARKRNDLMSQLNGLKAEKLKIQARLEEINRNIASTEHQLTLCNSIFSNNFDIMPDL